MKTTTKASVRPQNDGTATTRSIWLEIAAVLCFFCAPAFVSQATSLFWGDEHHERTVQRRHAQSAAAFDKDSFGVMVTSLCLVPIILVVMWKSGDGWAYFGVVRPKIGRDILLGLGLWLVVAILCALTSLAFNERHPWTVLYPVAIPWHRAMLLLGEYCALGFAEELTCRAYLIPRLDKVTRDTWLSVILSVVVCAFLHSFKTYAGIVHSLMSAAVWGIGFSLTRRIWPVAISHALMDFILYTHLAATLGA